MHFLLFYGHLLRIVFHLNEQSDAETVSRKSNYLIEFIIPAEVTAEPVQPLKFGNPVI
jgi:hypothetical protein